LLSSLASSTALADDKAACVDAYGKAQKLHAANELVSAKEQLRICARSTCPKFITKDCTAWLVDVESRLPSIVPLAKDASGAEISKATVTMDGTVITQDLDGHAIEVDGGRHTFTFTFADGRKLDREFVVAEGQKAQRVEVTMQAPEPATAPRDAATPAQVWGAPSANEGSSWSGRKTLALAVAGVGVAGLAVGTVFGLNAASSFSSQKNDCHSPAPGDCVNRAQALTDHDNAASASTISTIGFIAGGALVAAGAVLFFTAPKQGEEARSTTSAGLEVTPGVAPGSAGMWLRGRF
jgi:hypothetical protein